MGEKTIRVRIALVVDEAGQWNSAGWSGCETGAEAMDAALDGMIDSEGAEARYFVEVEVPVPETVTLSGRLVAEGG